MPDQLTVVLEEVRGCREDIAEMRAEQERRFTQLEVHDRECYGNGQPGWKQKFDDRISSIERKILLVTGGALVVGFIFHFAVDHFLK